MLAPHRDDELRGDGNEGRQNETADSHQVVGRHRRHDQREDEPRDCKGFRVRRYLEELSDQPVH